MLFLFSATSSITHLSHKTRGTCIQAGENDLMNRFGFLTTTQKKQKGKKKHPNHSECTFHSYSSFPSRPLARLRSISSNFFMLTAILATICSAVLFCPQQSTKSPSGLMRYVIIVWSTCWQSQVILIYFMSQYLSLSLYLFFS